MDNTTICGILIIICLFVVFGIDMYSMHIDNKFHEIKREIKNNKEDSEKNER